MSANSKLKAKSRSKSRSKTASKLKITVSRKSQKLSQKSRKSRKSKKPETIPKSRKFTNFRITSKKKSQKSQKSKKSLKNLKKDRYKRWCGRPPALEVGKHCVINRPEGLYRMNAAQTQKWREVENDPDEVSDFFKKISKEGALHPFRLKKGY